MSDLPVLPPLDPLAIGVWREAHARFADAEAAVPAAARSAARRLMRRLVIEGLANTQPVLVDPARPLLFPPPRRFLSLTLEQRLAGAGAAFRHLDVSAAMHRMDGGPPTVTSCTPHVLNALLSGPVTEREVNPGLLRMTDTRWKPDANPFGHPDPASVPELIVGAVDMAARAPAPAVARAGWLAFMIMTVHPFVDGNGRTARALFVALAGEETETGLDWGVLEQWGLVRDGYVSALQAGQRAERYAAADIDPAPFMHFGLDTSTRGATVSLARVAMLGDVAAELDLDTVDAELLLRVVIDRFLPLDALLDEAPDPTAAMARVVALVQAGHVRMTAPPAGCSPVDRRGRGIVIGPASMDLAGRLRGARYAGS
jgi:hypothetical protein